MLTDTEIARLRECLDGLNAPERDIVLRAAEHIGARLRIGIQDYGHWDPQNDSRNHAKEAHEEVVDCLVYQLMGSQT